MHSKFSTISWRKCWLALRGDRQPSGCACGPWVPSGAGLGKGAGPRRAWVEVPQRPSLSRSSMIPKAKPLGVDVLITRAHFLSGSSVTQGALWGQGADVEWHRRAPPLGGPPLCSLSRNGTARCPDGLLLDAQRSRSVLTGSGPAHRLPLGARGHLPRPTPLRPAPQPPPACHRPEM